MSTPFWIAVGWTVFAIIVTLVIQPDYLYWAVGGAVIALGYLGTREIWANRGEK